jgi:hypothetical protein
VAGAGAQCEAPVVDAPAPKSIDEQELIGKILSSKMGPL